MVAPCSSVKAWDPQRPPPVVYVWQAEDGHCVERDKTHEPNRSEVMNRAHDVRPI